MSKRGTTGGAADVDNLGKRSEGDLDSGYSDLPENRFPTNFEVLCQFECGGVDGDT